MYHRRKGGEAMFCSFDWNALYQFLLTALCMFLTYLGGRAKLGDKNKQEK